MSATVPAAASFEPRPDPARAARLVSDGDREQHDGGTAGELQGTVVLQPVAVPTGR